MQVKRWPDSYQGDATTAFFEHATDLSAKMGGCNILFPVGRVQQVVAKQTTFSELVDQLYHVPLAEARLYTVHLGILV